MKTKTATEHQEQVALFQMGVHPLLYAIPNGARTSINVAKKLKAEGLKKGVPDLCLPVARLGYHSLYIEMKRLKPRGSTQPHQKAWLKALAREGHMVYICWGAEAAWYVLDQYTRNKLILSREDIKRVLYKK